MKVKTMKVSRIKNAVKDLPRGSYRVADGATLLQEGNDPADHAHVRKVTPLATKIEELKNDPQYQSGAINREREKSTSRKRANKETRPL
jgi:hypothetical protein